MATGADAPEPTIDVIHVARDDSHRALTASRCLD